MSPGRGWISRYREFRRAQLEALRESNRSLTSGDPDATRPSSSGPEAAAPATESDHTLPLPELFDVGDPAPGTGPESAASRRYGALGQPLNRRSPFYLGFFGAFGALVAVGLWHVLGQLAMVLTILVVALFLTITIDPIVQALTRGGMPRGTAVAIVFAGVLAVVTALGLLVIPPVVRQGTTLLSEAPGYLQHLIDSGWVQDLDHHYEVIDKVRAELEKRISDGSLVGQVAGGVLGAGKAIISGVFQGVTVLILALYFLISFPRIKAAGYAMIPASRRERITSLSEEIIRRTGAYAVGQGFIATANAILSWVIMTILGIPYAAVLAVAVGLLGLIPLVGATIGAALVVVVAFFDEPKKAIIVAIYYLVYQQIENYLIAPRVMQRTVSVPAAVTIIAALAGGTLLGVLGALLAIPMAAGLLLLYEEVLLPRQEQH